VKTLSGRIGSAALIVVAAASLSACGVNNIPTKEAVAKQKWADVQTAYQRRADLIPNLVSTVKGFAAQEKSVLVEVTQARASATSVKVDPTSLGDPAQMAKYQQAQNNLSGVLGRLLVVQEKYPELKSDQNFMALQSQLEGTENRIAIARKDYNEAVTDYNLSLVTFPSVLWAKTIYSAEKPMQVFNATEAAQAAPTVNFDAAPAAAPAASTAAPGSAPPAKP
jgi:LemA protein